MGRLRPLVHGTSASLVVGFTLALGSCRPAPLATTGAGTEPVPIAPTTSPATAAPAASVSPVPEAEPEPVLDTWEMAMRVDGAACRDELTTRGFKFQAMPDVTARDRSGCGLPHGVVLRRGPTGIAYDPPVLVDCSLARVLVDVERIIQEEADTWLKSPIVKVANLGAFACRPRNFRKGASLSAHAFGTALDVSGFHPQKGAPAIVDRDYGPSPRSTASQDARRSFLHGVYQRLRRHEADLTYVVGPDFNATHRNHFHLDRGGWAFWATR